MSFKVAAFSYFVLILFSTAQVVHNAPNENASTFSKGFEIATNQLMELQNTLSKAFDVENAEQLQEKTIEQGKNIASKFDEWASDIKKHTETLRDNSAVRELESSVDKIIDEFNAKNLDKTTEIKSFFENIDNAAMNIIRQIKDLPESQEAKNIKNLSQQFLDNTVSIFQNSGIKLQESIKPAN